MPICVDSVSVLPVAELTLVKNARQFAKNHEKQVRIFAAYIRRVAPIVEAVNQIRNAIQRAQWLRGYDNVLFCWIIAGSQLEFLRRVSEVVRFLSEKELCLNRSDGPTKLSLGYKRLRLIGRDENPEPKFPRKLCSASKTLKSSLEDNGGTRCQLTSHDVRTKNKINLIKKKLRSFKYIVPEQVRGKVEKFFMFRQEMKLEGHPLGWINIMTVLSVGIPVALVWFFGDWISVVFNKAPVLHLFQYGACFSIELI